MDHCPPEGNPIIIPHTVLLHCLSSKIFHTDGTVYNTLVCTIVNDPLEQTIIVYAKEQLGPRFYIDY